MKPYVKTYLNHFGYTIADFIPCEICGKQAVDIHHIYARSIRKDLVNDIENLMALCRNCHQIYGDKKDLRGHLIKIHNAHLSKAKALS